MAVSWARRIGNIRTPIPITNAELSSMSAAPATNNTVESLRSPDRTMPAATRLPTPYAKKPARKRTPTTRAVRRTLESGADDWRGMPRRCSTIWDRRVGLDMVLSASGRHGRRARSVGELWLGGGLGVLGFDGRSGVAFGADAGEPLQPAGQVPVPVAEQRHRRGQQDAADDGGVDQDGDGEPESHLLEVEEAEGDEAREHADHHRGGAGHGPGGGRDPLPDGLVGAHAAVMELADPREDEDVVVHREPEEDHEQEQRQPFGPPADRGEPEQRLSVAVLEDEHEQAVGGPDREQVEDDRLDRDHDRVEGDQHEQERESEHEGEDQRQPAPQLTGEILRARRVAADVDARAGDLPDRCGDDLVAERGGPVVPPPLSRLVRRGVGSVVPRGRDSRLAQA